MTAQLGSVVIPAHDEEAVIARTLGHLADVAKSGLIDVIVVCNGCQDRTAEVARGFTAVRVLEQTQPSKTAALRAGERLAIPGPRIYLDADVELTGRAAIATLRAMADSTALAGRPPYRFNSARASWLVRTWYGVRTELPSISTALWGAGCYALSELGRARFGPFPELVADDLFVDSLFAAGEVTIVPTDPVVIHTPRIVRDLMRILRRSYRTQPAAGGRVVGLSSGQQSQLRDLLDLLRREPVRLLDVGVYLGVIAVSRTRARLGPAHRWERDASSRTFE